MRDDAIGDKRLDFQHAAVVEDTDAIARLDAARFGVDGIDHQLIGVSGTQPRHVVISRVRAAGTVVSVKFQRILLFGCVTLTQHFLRGDELRNRMNFLTFFLGQFPVLGNLSQSLGINLDLA